MPSGVTYNRETVTLDGESFDGCDFRDCKLVYSGGELPDLGGCRFENCEWKFDDAAARTLAQLKVLWTLGAKPAVQGFIKDITVSR